MAVIVPNDPLETSPLAGKIARYEDDKGRWVNAPGLIGWIADIVDVGGDLAGRNRNEQTEILMSYLTAVKELWPYAYEKHKEYYVWNPSGLEVMLKIFPNVYRRVMLHHGAMFTTQNFLESMQPIKDYAIIGDVPWSKENYKPFTSGGGRRELIRGLLNKLPPV